MSKLDLAALRLDPHSQHSKTFHSSAPIDPAPNLGLWADRLVECLFAIEDLAIEEGPVRTRGVPSYRRLDCDGRALAYLRLRPRHRYVRIDVPQLWIVPKQSSLFHPRALGQGVILIRKLEDVTEAIRFVAETVRATRRESNPAQVNMMLSRGS